MIALRHLPTLLNVDVDVEETLAYNDGRYEVSLAWKEDHVALNDNYQQAERRLHNLKKKLLCIKK